MSAPRRPATRSMAALSIAGEVLMTGAVIMGLFVAWQLWWTDVIGVRAQAAALTEYVARPEFQEAPASTEAAASTAPPPILDTPAIGEPIATVHIPTLGDEGLTAVFYEGVDRKQVLNDLGVGHYPGSAMPGQVGNFALAGHRMTYGKPFHFIHTVQVGDPIVVESDDAWFVYRVTEHLVVKPDQSEVLSPVPGDLTGQAVPTVASITLTACHPIGMNSLLERYIVHGELEYWAPKSSGTPVELLGGGS